MEIFKIKKKKEEEKLRKSCDSLGGNADEGIS